MIFGELGKSEPSFWYLILMFMNMNQVKAIIYARVSSKEQEDTGYSLDAQEKLLKEYATKDGFSITKVFRVSESASGKQIRKTFNEMLLYANKHKIPIILCEKIDRLTRNLKDAASISDWINEDEKHEVHFVKESFIVNKNTRAHENLVWDMKVAIARFYTNNLSEEVRKGQKEKIAQGGYPSKPPIGYKTIGEKGHKTHIIDSDTAPLVQKMFELYATGNYSISALVEILHKEGLRNKSGKKFGKTRMHETLSDPFYYGKFRWNGEIYPGQHESLISKELFDQVQQKLVRSNSNPQYKKHLSVFKAKMKCKGCGGVIAWEIQKNHWYGHCNHHRQCNQKEWIRQEAAENQLFSYFDNAALKNTRVLQWLEKAIKKDHAEEISYNTAKREGFNRAIRTADTRIENAYRDKLDGKMPAPLCEKMISESTKEKEAALEGLGKLSKSRTAYYEAGYALHELAIRSVSIYNSTRATQDEKRLLLSNIFSNLTLNADRISPNYTLAFEFLTEWVPRLNTIFEPTESGSVKGKENAFASSHPILLRRQDSNLRPGD